ncbi:MAG: RNA polymerase sigma factor [Niabella sp.]
MDDREAYSAAYLVLYNRFYNYGVHLYNNTELVEDVIQEVLLSVWMNRKGLGNISNPEGYYFVLFRRALTKKIREVSMVAALDHDEWEPEFAIDAIMIRKETDAALQKKLQSAINTLTSRQREAIFLRFYEGFSYEETAAVLGISVKATYKIMARSLLALRDKVALPLTYILFLLRSQF